MPFLIKPNHNELAELFNADVKSEEDIIKYGKELRIWGKECANFKSWRWGNIYK